MRSVFSSASGLFLWCAWVAMWVVSSAEAQTTSMKIMPMGDSLTRGNNDIGFPNGDIPGGYRKQLATRLGTAGLSFDFVGLQTDNPATGIDPNHASGAGMTTENLLGNLPEWLALDPETVLLHIGTNDILQNLSISAAAVSLDSIVGVILSSAPHRKLYVATIIPIKQAWNGTSAAVLNAAVNDYNTLVRTVVRQRANQGYKVFLVEMNGGITLTDPMPAKNFFQPGDGVHPGQAGYDQMGDLWFKAIAPSWSDVLANGSFELEFTGWTPAGNVAAAARTGTDGNMLAVFHAGDSAGEGTLRQGFATIPDTAYRVAFDAGASGASSDQEIEITVTGAAMSASQTVAITGPGDESSNWLPATLDFLADSTMTTLSFAGRTTDGASLLLDHVRVFRRTETPAQGDSSWTPLRAHPQNPHILEFRGQPVVLRTFAEHYGSVINQDFDFTPYLDVLQRDGMNLTRAFLAGFRHESNDLPGSPLAPSPGRFLQPWLRSGTKGAALDGLGKWDFATWNEDYFARLREFAKACGDRGIACEMTLFCTLYTDSEWRASPFNPANNAAACGPGDRYEVFRASDPQLQGVQEAVVRRIVRELAGFDNVYFEIQNEPFWNQPGLKDDQEAGFQNRILEVIREEESSLPNRHLVAHNFPQQAAAMSADFGLINEHYPTQIVVEGPDPAIAGAEALLGDLYPDGQILALDETHTAGPLQTRLEAWMFLIGGGGIYNGLDVPYFLYSVQDESGDSETGRGFRKVLQNLGSYIDGLDLIHLRRDLSWLAGGIPAGASVQAMANPTQQYVAYFHHGQRGAVGQLSYSPIDGSNHNVAAVVTLEPGTWRAVWARPSDLVELRVEEFAHTGGERTLAAVTYQEDVVLRVDRTGAGDTTPPPRPGGLAALSDAAGAIRLSWDPARAADVGSYRIYRSEDSPPAVAPDLRVSTEFTDGTHATDASAVPGNRYDYVVTAVDHSGNESAASDPVTVVATLDNLPHGGVAGSVPGTIEAENFDHGGEGVAYHDLTPANEGGEYRPADGVDLEATTDEGGGYQVFQTGDGEWLEYTVNVAVTNDYTFDLRFAAAGPGARLALTVDAAVLTSIDLPDTGGIANWQTMTVPGFALNAGGHLLRFSLASPGTEVALNWFSLTAVATAGPSANAGADLLVVDHDNSGFADAPLSASGSLAGDHPIQSFAWTKKGITFATIENPVLSLPPGNHVIQLKVTDSIGMEATDEIVVTVAPGGFVNGSFESGFTAWTATGNLHLQSAAPYAPTAGSKLVAFNAANLPPNGVLSQTFATAAGGTHTLAFDAGVLSYNTSAQKLLVTVTGIGSLLSQSISITGLSGGSNRWIPQNFTFVADSALTTLTFRDQSTATINLDLMLDNIRLSGPPPAIPNTVPAAIGNTYSLGQDTVFTAPSPGVLGNDTDDDSNPLTAVLDAAPGHGTVALNSDGGFTYAPATGYFGSDSFTYHARDGIADSNTATVSLTILEVITPPVATDDSFTTVEEVILSVPAKGVLANDSDARSRPLTAILHAGPSHGSLELDAGGGFVYTPSAGYFGSDSFTYHVGSSRVDLQACKLEYSIVSPK